MPLTIPFFKIWTMILLGSSFSLVVAHAQSTPTQNRKPATLQYTSRMEKSAKEMQWSMIYYLSFKRTNEAVYLKLAATHCSNAIHSLHGTQSMVSRTTRFYFQTKSKRLESCRFYQTLRQTSLRLSLEHHLEGIGNSVCQP